MDTAKRLLAAVSVLVLCAQGAWAWGNATHMYLARQLGSKLGPVNACEMYGSVLPDVFAYAFDANGRFMYDVMHHNFMPVYNAAWKPGLKAVGFGFVSHNDTWGADHTAHHQGFTTGGEGYAIAKGGVLAPHIIPVLVGILNEAGLPSPDADYVAGLLAPEMGHDLSETAVDLLVRRNLDRGIGARMMLAASTRPADVPQLIADVYAADLAAASGIPVEDARALLIGAEREYKSVITQYGLAFTLPEERTIALLAGQTAPIAEMLIEANVPGLDVTVTAAQVEGFIRAAITVVEQDYARELAATLRYVERGLRQHHVTSASLLFALEEGGEASAEEEDVVTAPAAFSLDQNYPNPFNPSTTIAFALPVSGPASLRIYSTLGQEVATLVNEVLPAGQHRVVWNAAGLSSGLYFCRLECAGKVLTQRMTLMK